MKGKVVLRRLAQASAIGVTAATLVAGGIAPAHAVEARRSVACPDGSVANGTVRAWGTGYAYLYHQNPWNYEDRRVWSEVQGKMYSLGSIDSGSHTIIATSSMEVQIPWLQCIHYNV
ncbi:MAG: hypothetical protein ACRDAX_00335 [Propionibacteriaceae bacterium]